MKKLILLLSFLIVTQGCEMQEHISIVPPNQVEIIETNVVDTNYDGKMFDVNFVYGGGWEGHLSLNQVQSENLDFEFLTEHGQFKIKPKTIMLKNLDSNGWAIVKTLYRQKNEADGEFMHLETSLIESFNFFINENPNTNYPNCKAINLTIFDKKTIQMNDNLYKLRDGVEAFRRDKYVQVGDYAFTYNAVDEKIDKVYKKIKDDSPLSDLYTPKEIIVGLQIATGGGGVGYIQRIYEDAYGDNIYRLRTSMTENVVDGDTLTLRAYDIVYWDGKVFPYVRTFSDPSDIEANRMIVLRDVSKKPFHYTMHSKKTDIFQQKTPADTEFWEEVPFEKGIHLVSTTNQNKCVDRGLDTRTYMPNGGKIKFKIEDCAFDHVALANTSTSKVRVKLLDENGNEITKETRYFLPKSAGDVEHDLFADCCKADFPRCKKNMFQTIPVLLTDDYDNRKTTVEVEFFGESYLGNFFAGKSIGIGCVSVDLNVETSLALKVEIDNLSGLGQLKKDGYGLSLSRTDFTIKHKSYKKAKTESKLIRDNEGHLVFFNTTFYKNGKVNELFDWLSHSGVMMGANYNLRENTTTAMIHQLNNTQRES